MDVLLPSISRKILTDQLRGPENDRLIGRKSFPEIPPRVEYTLSQKAESLLPILRNLSDWVSVNYPEYGLNMVEEEVDTPEGLCSINIHKE